MSTVVKLTAHSTVKSSPKWTLATRSPTQDRGDPIPGPGKYGTPPTGQDSRKSRTPSFPFGSSLRAGDGKRLGINSKWRVPGPGSYMPDNPSRGYGPKWGFGAAAQRPAAKVSGNPPPGAYNVRLDLRSSGGLMAGKRQGSRSSSAPGPGAYTPGYTQLETTPKWGFGADSRKEDPETRAAKTLPGPGTYETLKGLGGNIATKNSPTFAFTSRRPPAMSDTTPGPHVMHTSFD
mmetsp:Transcript_19021/g.44376  ORF Transcript_19021/g.44376 Transcript_19021/m.44376 type:complete len:233 (-) Transcript_19021:89-787(-)|eukprot:CAMPEP_0178444022 /NCGR_PEP_ID=MMETSP0689_2-20121128/39249_1 /TAXON_ID=160604 /ORGANISM="Amphidinium massartii, Strain CS-259" /LENGTH=232 /DNA_ID=CAMNT_0020068153 /DNA_START=41 /DNA_END=739 /DNA_ORIENTATION=+